MPMQRQDNLTAMQRRQILLSLPDDDLVAQRDSLLAATSLLNRTALGSRFGSSTYGGNRDLYQTLGYKTTLTYDDYAVKYERQDIATAVIDRPAEATWKDAFEIVESSDDNETALEKEWKLLFDRLNLKNKFERLDKLASLGRYGVLFLGLSDATRPELQAQPVTGTKNKLMYVKPLGEGSAEIASWNEKSDDPRYGLPEFYTLKLGIGTESNKTSTSMKVHHSRIIHVVGKTLESESLGTPALRAIFNRLEDLERIVGASSEMFWRGGRPGYTGKIDKDFQMGTEAREDLAAQITEMEHDLRRFLISDGVDISALASQVADPASHVDIQIQMISAETGIPKRILTGSERGELSSSQDKDTWKDKIDTRRNDIGEQQIIRPFIDRGIEIGFLPPAGSDGYQVEWPDSYALTEMEQADIGTKRATSLKDYSSNAMAEDMVPLEAFLKIIWGLNDDQIELIKQYREAAQAEEEALSEEEKKLMEEEEAKKRGTGKEEKPGEEDENAEEKEE